MGLAGLGGASAPLDPSPSRAGVPGTGRGGARKRAAARSPRLRQLLDPELASVRQSVRPPSAMAPRTPAPRTLLLLLLSMLLPPPGACGEVCVASRGGTPAPDFCPDFCCGACDAQYCCSDVLKKLVWNEEACAGPETSAPANTEPLEQLGSALRFRSSFDTDPMSGFGATVAIGLTIFVLSVVTIIICFTCSCCCLYKMCRRPRPVVTTTTATTVVHAPYPQPPSAPPSYPGPTYQGYHPMPSQPGVPAAPYPTQYPPPYLAQPMGPPAYHETLAGGAATPYLASQPPYNPAYTDPPRAVP